VSRGGDLRRLLGHLISCVLQLGDFHHVLDTLGELRRHELHALTELAGKQVGLALGRLAKGPRAARVRVEGNGRQRDDGQQEEGDNQAKS
jgi:hypothetical protein